MKAAPSVPVRDALVLAAGNGDRFRNGSGRSKLLQPILGRPLILKTLETARDAGISSFEIVLGYEADRVRAVIEREHTSNVRLHFSYNPEWHLENGLSALVARERCEDRRFALLMGDHVFTADMLATLLQTTVGAGESILAIDSRPASLAVTADATKVRAVDGYIIAIGKDVDPYDALDTGLFVCQPTLFAALDAARAAGDTTLSGGIRRLAAQGLMRGIEIPGSEWYDIDTVADLQTAQARLSRLPART